MSIELHCPRCGKLIRAPDDAGGKRGKCPYCQAGVYVPMPAGEEDDIPLAPLDSQDVEREAQLRREATSYAASLDRARESPPERGDKAPVGPPTAPPVPPPGAVVDLGAEVKAYIRAMRDSKRKTLRARSPLVVPSSKLSLANWSFAFQVKKANTKATYLNNSSRYPNSYVWMTNAATSTTVSRM